MTSMGDRFRPVGRALARPGRGLSASQRRRPLGFLVVLGVVVLLLGALSGFVYQQQHDYDVTKDRRQAALQTAREQSVALLSYNYRSVGQELAREKEALTGQFKTDYVRLVRQLLAPAARRQQATVSAQVRAAAVTENRAEQVEALVFVTQRINSNATPRARQAGRLVRMVLDRTDGRWLVSQLTGVSGA